MLIALAVTLNVALGPAPIIRRADRADSLYRALGERYPAAGKFGRIGDGTLIGERWVITAAHVARAVQNRGASFEVGGRSYLVRRVVLHPAWREMEAHDIAMVELAEAVSGVVPLRLYRGSSEVGQTAALVGHGGAGTGSDRARAEDGLVRGATSRVDSADASWLYFSFDAPPAGSDLEGAPGPGDSGGPAIVSEGGVVMVAGISSAGFDGAQGPGSYGAVDAFTRVSTHVVWVDSVLAAPEPSAAAPPATLPGAATIPATPAGDRARAFVAAMRAGTDSAISGFLRDNLAAAQLAARPAELRLPNFRRLAGDLRGRAVAAVSLGADAITIEFRHPDGTVISIELIVEPDAPHRILDWRRRG